MALTKKEFDKKWSWLTALLPTALALGVYFISGFYLKVSDFADMFGEGPLDRLIHLVVAALVLALSVKFHTLVRDSVTGKG